MNLAIFDDLHRVAFIAINPLLVEIDVKAAIDFFDDHGAWLVSRLFS